VKNEFKLIFDSEGALEIQNLNVYIDVGSVLSILFPKFCQSLYSSNFWIYNFVEDQHVEECQQKTVDINVEVEEVYREEF
jgi:hypothetical protein